MVCSDFFSDVSFLSYVLVLVLVLVLNKDHVNHQKDAHHLASVYPGYILMSGVII